MGCFGWLFVVFGLVFGVVLFMRDIWLVCVTLVLFVWVIVDCCWGVVLAIVFVLYDWYFAVCLRWLFGCSTYCLVFCFGGWCT